MTEPLTTESRSRKLRSEAVLRAEGVPVNFSLPEIETESEVTLRTKDEVALRALTSLVVALKGAGLDQTTIDRITIDYRLASAYSPDEQQFILDPSPTDRDRIKFSWRYEAAWCLLWTLGFVETLGRPSEPCDVAYAVRLMKESGASKFITDARLRPVSEILDEADLIYRYHWAVVNARTQGGAPPAGLHPGVTYERHYALNWLIGYLDQDWDDVTTDT